MYWPQKIDGVLYRDYDSFLAGPYWKRTWELYLGDNRTSKYCFICFSPNFQLHHENYNILGYEQENHNYRKLVPLCWKCHKLVHFDEDHEKVPLEYEFLHERRLILRGAYLRHNIRPTKIIPLLRELVYRVFW